MKKLVTKYRMKNDVYVSVNGSARKKKNEFVAEIDCGPKVEFSTFYKANYNT